MGPLLFLTNAFFNLFFKMLYRIKSAKRLGKLVGELGHYSFSLLTLFNLFFG